MNFPLEKENGIFSYLYKKFNGKIDSYITTSVSFPFLNGYPPSTLFDSNRNSYWIVENNAPENNFLTFCFKNLDVKITGYRITTPSVNYNDAWPKKWGFIAMYSPDDSNDNETIVELKTPIQHYDSYKTNYSRSVHKCFRYINHEFSELGYGYRSRISEIELYGILYGFSCPTIGHLRFTFIPSVLFISILI